MSTTTTTTTTTDARTQEKERWIAQHGSAQLQRMLASGYASEKRYATERARHEHPDYELDWGDETQFRECDSPSDAAFAEAKRVGGQVVEMYGLDEDRRNPWTSEAVVIENYLGRYWLCRMF